MANILEIIFKGTNQTDTAAAGVKKNLDGIQQSAKSVGSAMDVAMGVLASTQMQRFSDAAGQMLKTMVGEAGEAQAIMAQLEAVIKSTGGAAGLSAEEVDKMATSFANMTAYEDDAILAGQTILLQFTKIGEEVFPQATQAMLDLSTRMKVDIPTAAKLVGKALEGEFGGLSRFGIVIDDATKKTIENLMEVGKTAEAQAIIIEEMNKRFGGAAEAQAKTFQGMMTGLRNDWNNALESMGKTLADNPQIIGFFETLRGAIQSFTEWFDKQPDTIQTAIVGIVAAFALLGKIAPTLFALKILLGGAGIGGALAKLGGSAGAAKGILAGLGGVLAGISAPVWMLIAAIAALIALLVVFGPELKVTFMMIADIIAASLNRAIFEVKKFWNNLISSVKQMAANVKAWFKQVGTGIVQGIWDGIKTGWEWLKTNISSSITSLLQWVKDKLGIKSPSEVFAKAIGEPMAQGVGLGFKRALRLSSPMMGAALMPSPAFGGSSGGYNGVGINVQTVRVYGELSPEAQRRMRKQAEGIAYDSTRMLTRRARR